MQHHAERVTDSHGGHAEHHSYRSLLVELMIEFVIMYLVMYTMIATLDHFHFNPEQRLHDTDDGRSHGDRHARGDAIDVSLAPDEHRPCRWRSACLRFELRRYAHTGRR
jgi:hypothetical protein